MMHENLEYKHVGDEIHPGETSAGARFATSRSRAGTARCSGIHRRTSGIYSLHATDRPSAQQRASTGSRWRLFATSCSRTSVATGPRTERCVGAASISSPAPSAQERGDVRSLKGVAAFYCALRDGVGLGEGNPIFYVSSSPWNLFPTSLNQFR